MTPEITIKFGVAIFATTFGLSIGKTIFGTSGLRWARWVALVSFVCLNACILKLP